MRICVSPDACIRDLRSAGDMDRERSRSLKLSAASDFNPRRFVDRQTIDAKLHPTQHAGERRIDGDDFHAPRLAAQRVTSLMNVL